jgi:hypothetical protein
LNYPTPGIPRTADGKPNLSAPAPRTSDGKPDLSGLWSAAKYESDFKPSDALPWAVERAKQLDRPPGGPDSWTVRCVPPGPMINFTGPMRIVQSPRMTAILYETSNNYRQIFTDGRLLPKDPNPTWQGYSVGRWDGDAFVVETIGFNDRSTIGRPAYPYGEDLRLTERYRRRDFGHIDLEMIVEDRKTFSRAWRIRGAMTFDADTDMLEFVCNENEKDRARLLATPQTSSSEPRLDPASLAKNTGTYEVTRPNGTRVTVRVTVEGDQLMLALGGGTPRPLVPQSATMFTARGGVAVEFITNDQGIVTSLIAHNVEGDMKGPRTGP